VIASRRSLGEGGCSQFGENVIEHIDVEGRALPAEPEL
jgi:hypothetical protein